MSSVLSHSLFLLFLARLVGSSSSPRTDGDDGLWCRTEELDAFETVGRVVQSTGNLSQIEFQRLVDEILQRFPCFVNEDNSTDPCKRWLPTAEKIFSILALTSEATLDRHLFERASVVFVTHLFWLAAECHLDDANSTWNTLDEDGFAEYLLRIPGVGGHEEEEQEECLESDGSRCLAFDQMENLLRTLSVSYVSGAWKNLTQIFTCGQGELENTAVRDLNCDFGTTKSFDSRLLWELLDANHSASEEHSNHHEHGINKTQLGHLSSIIFAKLLSGDCISETDETSAPKIDFVKSIFKKFGDPTTCRISNEGFQQVLKLLKIGSESKSTVDSHSDHSHKRRKRRSTEEHSEEHDDINVETTCLSIERLLNSFRINSTSFSLSKSDFQRLSSALIQQASIGCQPKPEATQSPVKTTSTAAAYGYGTLAVAIVSACVVFALIIVRWKNSIIYRYLISSMLGLAVGSLAGDALLHLIPEALGAHGHDESGSDEHSAEDGTIVVEPYVWLSLCGCGSLWFYYNLQLLLYKAADIAGVIKRVLCRSKPKVLQTQSSEGGADCSNIQLSDYGGTPNSAFDNCSLSISGSVSDKERKEKEPKNKKNKREHDHLHDDEGDDVVVHSHSSVAWMITIGDGIHNFADGLAMGAAFSTDWQTGIATTIAIFTHELPHEFGDTAVLLSAGWSTKKVLLFQLLSQVTAFIGLYIGISVSETTEGAQQWIAAVASGMFLYIALADVIPELIEFFSHYSPLLIFITSNLGIAVGFLAMVLLAVYEERISIK